MLRLSLGRITGLPATGRKTRHNAAMTVGGWWSSQVATALCLLMLAGCSLGNSPPPAVDVTPPPPAVTVTTPPPVVTVTPPPPATTVNNISAVSADGKIMPGYTLGESRYDDDIEANNCDEPSGAGISPDTYGCESSVFGADACWLGADDDLICIDEPWDSQLYVLPIVGKMPSTAKAEDPVPLGLQLEDGSRFRLRNGPAYSGVDPDGFRNIYRCVSGPCGDDPGKTFAVMEADGQPPLNTTTDAWTVLVGQMLKDSSQDPSAVPQPEPSVVTRAWFIAADL